MHVSVSYCSTPVMLISQSRPPASCMIASHEVGPYHSIFISSTLVIFRTVPSMSSSPVIPMFDANQTTSYSSTHRSFTNTTSRLFPHEHVPAIRHAAVTVADGIKSDGQWKFFVGIVSIAKTSETPLIVSIMRLMIFWAPVQNVSSPVFMNSIKLWEKIWASSQFPKYSNTETKISKNSPTSLKTACTADNTCAVRNEIINWSQ